MPTITSAGAGSGLDLESVIAASVDAKKAQLMQPITTKKTNTQITLSGVGQLKSAIASFVTTLQAMAKDDAFNKRSINITQDKDKPVLKVESKAGASNGQYDISVEQLAKTSKFDGTFDSSTTPLITQDGKLTFKAGDKTFDVDVKAGDSLQSIRKRINNDADNFGLSVNIMNTSDGKSKLMIDSGVSGSGKDLQITGSTTELTDNLVSKLTKSQSAQDAKIKVDGNELTSATNTFDGTIVGLKLTVLRESDSTTTTDASNNPVKTYSSNKVEVTTDKAGIKDMVKSFVDGYNALVKKSNELGKRNSIVAGKSQNDGGALAGDATTRAVINMMNGAITEPSKKSSTYSTIFQMGVKMDNKGVLSIDDTKFSEAIDKNFDQVVAVFGGKDGVAGKLAGQLETYSKTGGLLAKREDTLNSDLREVSRKESDVASQLTKYQETLRARYGSLDTMLAKMNKSASYLNLLNTKSN
ncbi:flagellar filament capping protein FliD [Aeromonas hydrophila]|uniref:flagellar filament capping protein FliD n=1 Tax=Aeromonas hydrophila TaxID=644 RepID=UPI001A8CB3F3|nr:flagellar filament capping protein FliD [Aeromonas hydrophila]MBQ4667214.1 flagellar filament capping protein FliD [Aeromonas hydrophila]MBQ4714423.1 flagellar filament capping protein FliD [Aeromonas hydrophila]MBW3822839.1 flagellar filament capping protein FliD [Aeromonas hydrophila]MBW5268930.1 flagellar filament capping protein FliD [Aeromonas hydrophila]QSR52248.1 flagellar filament capping protein FliD [Aeromonas hydrophila]